MLSSNPRHNMTLRLYEANVVAKYLRASSSISKIVCVDVLSQKIVRLLSSLDRGSQGDVPALSPGGIN